MTHPTEEGTMLRSLLATIHGGYYVEEHGLEEVGKEAREFLARFDYRRRTT